MKGYQEKMRNNKFLPWLHRNMEPSVIAQNEIKILAQLNEKEFFSVKELAEKLGISQISAYNLIKTPFFPCLKIGQRFFIPTNMFNNWVQWKIENTKSTYDFDKEN